MARRGLLWQYAALAALIVLVIVGALWPMGPLVGIKTNRQGGKVTQGPPLLRDDRLSLELLGRMAREFDLRSH